jgi:hypothetical protein
MICQEELSPLPIAGARSLSIGNMAIGFDKEILLQLSLRLLYQEEKSLFCQNKMVNKVFSLITIWRY